MLHDKIRQERERLRISQMGLARRSGVARSQLAAFEHGANISVATLEKILRELSTLRLELVPANLDLDQARREAAELEAYAAAMHAAASRLVAALKGTTPAAGHQGGGGGAELLSGDGTDISPQKREELARLVEESKKRKPT